MTANTADAAAAAHEYYSRNAQSSVERALDAIAKARAELNHIEENLKLAADGKPYYRLGGASGPSIAGLDSGAVFEAFHMVEVAATIAKFAQR